MSGWSLRYDGFDPATEGVRESLCALGNGYFTTRGAAPWASADGVRYPGTYLAGGYNRLKTRIAGREVENEDLVNLPNWLMLELRVGGSEWFCEERVHLISHRQELNLRRGLLTRWMSFEDSDGRRTSLEEQRLVSMADMHTAALELRLTPENWSGTVTVRSGIDARVVNAGARLYAKFDNRHLEPTCTEALAKDSVLLCVRTVQSDLRIAQAARTRFFHGDAQIEPPRRLVREAGRIFQECEVAVESGRTLRLEKLAVLYTSRDAAVSEPTDAARREIQRLDSFGAVRAPHVFAWRHLWRRFNIRLRVTKEATRLNVPMLLRLNMFHLLQAASTNSIGLDIGIPARGWTGEAYQGHIFWDELFILPTLTFRQPEITRSLLMYRYRRLGAARLAAKRAGFRGAMFPWQSGSDGQEETQAVNLNPRSQRWVPDNSFRQRHVGAAIAWNTWQYVQTTDDREFLQSYGAELILEIARYWASAAQWNEGRGRYDIRGVMGPDEFHEGNPGETPSGVDNNAYTNIMVAWVLARALDVLDALPALRRAELVSRLGISGEETSLWDDISHRLFVPFLEDGMLSQFEGYEQLEELDWDAYRTRYGDIHRLELILEAEGDSANRYKLAKQADVLMLFYLFSADELCTLLDQLGYQFDREDIPRTVAYYDARCSHGSTLSRVVHAWVLARANREKASAYFAEALQSDLMDIQGGTAAEGVHLGAMAGTVDLAQRVCTGVEVREGMLRLDPSLPVGISRLEMRLRYRGYTLDLLLTEGALRLRALESAPEPIRLTVGAEQLTFAGGERTFKIAEGQAKQRRPSRSFAGHTRESAAVRRPAAEPLR